jgi:hypothetical protein
MDPGIGFGDGSRHTDQSAIQFRKKKSGDA